MSRYRSVNGTGVVRASVAAILGAATLLAYAPMGVGAEQRAADSKRYDYELEAVTVTGSRIVRRDTESNSPLVTVEREVLDQSTFTSIEEALNDLPEFMAGGAGVTAGAVTGLQAANDLAGGQGAGNMFNMSMLPDNGRIGVSLPGVATINLRGLGVNRSLTLIDGHRGVPSTASGVLDLNNIPSSAIQSIEVITGGASAVYGADALAGVTNVKLRDDYEGVNVRLRGGINEVGDGEEYQASTIMGVKLADRGSAMLGMEYTKRESAYWENRDFFREAMASEYSGAGNYAFHWYPAYGAGASPTGASAACLASGTGCTTTSALRTAGGGSLTIGQFNQWAGNAPTQNAVNAVFFDRTCGTGINCVSTTGNGQGFGFNPDGTLFTRSSQTGTGATSVYYGPQSFTRPLAGTKDTPDEVTCAFLAATGVSQAPGFTNYPCNPTINRVDWGRWLTSPRESYSMFGRAKYQVSERVEAFSTAMFASTRTETRREPSPSVVASQWTVPISYHSNASARYLPSIAQARSGSINVGDTLPEYRVGGTRGTNCAPTGGCTMAQAFPVSPELATLLNSRPNVTYGTTGGNATNPWRGLSACELRAVDLNAGLPGHVSQVAPASGVAYTTQIDPNTGESYKICGPNSAWRLGQTLDFLPPRGTTNETRNWQISGGLRGDLGLADWTWEAYASFGDSRANTAYDGFVSYTNYFKIITAPNYGQGFKEEGTGSKLLTCTSGLNPFTDTPVSADCIDAISSNQYDRNAMRQQVYEFNLQGHVADLPAGEARAALGVSQHRNQFSFTPDALRERDYVGDVSPGQFGISSLAESVSVKEVYGELLVPLLKDLPAIQKLELELGGRWSKYSTGQGVPTWKALVNWEPLPWIRARGGYNRAERAPNIAELYSKPSVSAQFNASPVDVCRTDQAALFPNTSNVAANPNRAQLQALCSAQIDAWGGNGASVFQADPNNFTAAQGAGGGSGLIVGNPDLKSEKGQTWTLGLVFGSPWEGALLRGLSTTLDWYEARIDGPIETRSAQSIMNACFNVDGSNPTYSLNDPGGYCALIERNPETGGLLRSNLKYDNYGKIIIRGVDVAIRWNVNMSDLGFESVPGRLSLYSSANILLNQKQALTAGGTLADYAGLNGASKLRVNTNFSYSWDVNRVGLTWDRRHGTRSAEQVTTGGVSRIVESTRFAGYPAVDLFNLSASRRFGSLNASLSVSNLLDTKPARAGYDWNDPLQGFGSFDPNGDLVGRRYSVNLSMDF